MKDIENAGRRPSTRARRSRWGIAGTALAAVVVADGAAASPITSVSRISFGPENVLFVADWRASTVHALKLPSAPAGRGAPFNVADLDRLAASTLHTSKVRIDDIAPRPGADEVYVAVTYGTAGAPAILRVGPAGTATAVDLSRTSQTETSLQKPPPHDLVFWTGAKARSFTVTDMKFRDGRLYAAGLSNQTFASSLRVLPYPFKGEGELVSVEMYHTTHDQIETRAPIRAMAFTQLDGKPYLLAAYLCTPLVTIPLDALRNGAHVQGKTIAELGDAGIPTDLVPYTAMDFATGKPRDMVLAANLFREGSVVPLASIAEANRGPGLSHPVAFGEIAGVLHTGATLAGVYRIEDQNPQFFVALRRDLASGHAQLVSISKMTGFRLSDYDVSEFMFPGYRYAKDPEHEGVRKTQNMMKTAEGFPQAVRP